MNEVIKVKIDSIYLGDFHVEVMQKPNGDYSLSRTDIADIVKEERQSFSNFLDGESDLALPFKGVIFPSAKVPGKKGALPDAVPIPIAIAYWRYCDRRGNKIAAAIIAACTQESIERRADKVFGISLSEEERNIKFSATVKDFVSSSLIPWNIAIDGSKPFVIEFYEHLYRIRGGDWLKRDPRISQRPACVGGWTNKFVYDLFPGSIPFVLKEQYKNQSTNYRKYEFLTQEIGRSYLALHMASLLSIMRISPSGSWSRFLKNVEIGIPTGAILAIQMELDFLIEIEEDCARRLEEGN